MFKCICNVTLMWYIPLRMFCFIYLLNYLVIKSLIDKTIKYNGFFLDHADSSYSIDDKEEGSVE